MSLPQTISIRHRAGSYVVKVTASKEFLKNLPAQSVILTDANVFQALNVNETGRPTLVLKPGESSKSVEVLGRVWEWLAQVRADRRTVVVALGGGVIGDVAGFAAATYMRGVPLIQAPTTLLAQVDSSVGGKTGIDLKGGKNLAGAFYPPQEVHLLVDTLAGLSPRQFANGMAEVIKYGFILDADMVEDLAKDPLTPTSPRLADVIMRCVRLKADIVEQDELDVTGQRAILNYGHTVGHALELLTGYGPLLHGEAIAVGMVVEARIGELLGVTAPGTVERVAAALAGAGLPTTHELLRRPDEVLSAMRLDKKVERGQMALSLLECMGRCKLVREVSDRVILEAMAAS